MSGLFRCMASDVLVKASRCGDMFGELASQPRCAQVPHMRFNTGPLCTTEHGAPCVVDAVHRSRCALR